MHYKRVHPQGKLCTNHPEKNCLFIALSILLFALISIDVYFILRNIVRK